MNQKIYVYAGMRPWNLREFEARVSRLPGNWHFLSCPDVLTLENLLAIKPRYVFFPHWSERVPKSITDAFECVCFHETDLPFGRGGSPIQNLIVRGFKDTKISALRMQEELDAGPIYLKRTLSLEGSAQEIYERATQSITEMIKDIIEQEPAPSPQQGEVKMFERRKPEQSRVGQEQGSLDKFYDHIRMLDAEGYPKAFIEYGGFRIEFEQAELKLGELQAKVRITKDKE